MASFSNSQKILASKLKDNDPDLPLMVDNVSQKALYVLVEAVRHSLLWVESDLLRSVSSPSARHIDADTPFVEWCTVDG